MTECLNTFTSCPKIHPIKSVLMYTYLRVYDYTYAFNHSIFNNILPYILKGKKRQRFRGVHLIELI